ncbi:CinA family protein [Campylobacter sp. MIT 99-7217]|uniref:CinA family protein n=1 Tax=Campylobacter sp. MIT 99-7217 TaxID=535091 RepID=UPI001158F1E4|nr:CinA family protein [Campylobacter sp. MIT 99-7217]TQR33049.1 CinA family protein [Campylobacter sp. MIT 99-7217]
MNHLLFIIGEELANHEIYQSYIKRTYKEKFKQIKDIKILEKNDKNLPFILGKLFADYEFISIFVDKEEYHITTKILATLNEDTLVLQDEILVPQKALEFRKDSFLTQIQNCKINVIRTEVGDKLPSLLGEIQTKFEYFYLQDTDKQGAKILLETLSKSYEVSIQTSEILKNLTLVKATQYQFGKLQTFLQATKKLFGTKFILGDNLLELIANKLLENELKISFAESCTGGLCASELTKIHGVSSCFEGSVISYSNRLKHEWLGISESVLEHGGEYSEKCVYFMLKGIFKISNCDFALATSGVVGENADKGTASGTVYIGAMYKDGSYLQECLNLQGDRAFMQTQACIAVFSLMMKLKPEIFE